MKKIMMAAVAATFMSTGAQAESFSESCGHLDNPTRFNPTELSAYQECWLDYHKPDEMAGVLGGIFYARAGDSIVSMPVSDLRSAGSAGAAQAIVVERIVEVINNERVEELEGIIEGLNDDITLKNAEIASLEAARDLLVEQGVTQAAIDSLNMRITALEMERDARYTQAAYDMFGMSEYTRGETEGRVGYVTEADRDAHGAAEYTRGETEGRVGYVTQADRDAHGMAEYTRGETEGRVGYVTEAARDTHGTNEYNRGQADQIASIGLFLDGVDYVSIDMNGIVTLDRAGLMNAARMAVMFPTSVAVSATKNITIPAAVETGYNYDNSHTNTGIGNAVFWHHSGAPGSTVNGFNNSYWIGTTNALVEAIQETYDAGFNDGYDEGYADGYSDGFRDGVRAVQ